MLKCSLLVKLIFLLSYSVDDMIDFSYTVTPFKFADIKFRGFEIKTYIYSRPFNFAVSYQNYFSVSYTRLLGRPQPQMYPPVALNQYTLVNITHKHYIYIYTSRPHKHLKITPKLILGGGGGASIIRLGPS